MPDLSVDDLVDAVQVFNRTHYCGQSDWRFYGRLNGYHWEEFASSPAAGIDLPEDEAIREARALT